MLQPKISMWQLVLLLTVSRVFCALNGVLLGTGGGYGVAYLIAIPLSALMQFILLLPVLYFSQKQGESIVETGYSLWGKGGRALAFLLGGYFLLQAVLTVFSAEQFMVNAIYPQSSPAFFILTLVGACCYAAYLKLPSIARSGTIVFIVLICSVAFAFLGNLGQINLIFVRPLGTEGFGEVLRIAVSLTARSPEIWLFAVLTPYLSEDGHRKRGVFYYLLFSSLLLEIAVFLISAVLGVLGEGEAFPFYTVGTLAKISILQRLDAVHMSVWIFVSFIRTGIFLWAAAELFCRMVSSPKRRFILPFLAALIAAGGVLCGMDRGAADLLYQVAFSSVPIFVFLPLLSIALLVSYKARETTKKGGKTDEEA